MILSLEFGLREEDFRVVDSFFPEGFSVDAFGSLRYHVVDTYFTRYPCLGSSKLDNIYNF